MANPTNIPPAKDSTRRPVHFGVVIAVTIILFMPIRPGGGNGGSGTTNPAASKVQR